jgi:6-phosphogluconolactonase
MIRAYLTAALLAALVAFLFAAPPGTKAADEPKPDKLWVFVGTYTGGKGDKASKGIYRYELDLATGKLTGKALAAEVKSPSFLAIHPSRKFLYAVNEGGTDSTKKGAITAFALDPKTGALKMLNEKTSGGDGPCHLVVDAAGKNVLAANYGGGSVTCVPIKDDGSLGEPSAFIQHTGKVADPKRQGGPHAHSINLDAANKYAFAADLGLDRIFVYKFDPAKGTLTPNDPPSASTAQRAGPRHFAFHPSGKFAYAIDEIDLTVTPFAYDAAKGVLTPLKPVSTVPEGGDRKDFSTAEVQVHPSGKFLYGSNRGHNSIAIFTIDEKTGELTPAGHYSKDVKTPRNFGIDPTGTYLIIANQDGDSLTVTKIDPKTGALTEVGEPIEAPKPVCVKFVPVAK